VTNDNFKQQNYNAIEDIKREEEIQNIKAL
jgi:hypothetical protein